MTIDGQQDVDGLMAAGQVVAQCMHTMARAMEPGMTTAELDAIGAAFLRDHGAESAPQLTYDFPGATCISINDEAAHGMPGDRVLEEGDMVNIDVSARLGEYFGDTGASFVLGESPSELQARLSLATQEALAAALRVARDGRPLRGLGKAMEKTAKRAGFRVIRNLGSHGIGRALHEEPTEIPGFDDPNERRRLRRGMVITVEPFLTTGKSWVRTAADGWTLLNSPGSLNAQFEHTIIITQSRPIITTLLEAS